MQEITDEDRERLRHLLDVGLRQQQGLTWSKINPGIRKWIDDGIGPSPTPKLLAAADELMKWAAGTSYRVLCGDEPADASQRAAVLIPYMETVLASIEHLAEGMRATLERVRAGQ